MEENENWDIEEFKTKFESEEHWNLKKEFMLAHKSKFPKERLACLAQVFINIELLQCRYPDAVMRQVAELSKDIGNYYKTKQKVRLQRTFVKASDAANAKVRGEKPKLGSAAQIPLKRSFVKEEASESFMDNEYEKFSASLPPKITEIKNAGQDSMAQLQRSCASCDINSEDPLASNLLLVHRSFLKINSTFHFLLSSAQFSKIKLFQNFSSHKYEKMSICTLTVKIKSDVITLGSGKDVNEKMAREAASKDAVEKLLQKCYTFEIKTPAVGNEEITLNTLGGSHKELGDQIYYTVPELGDRISDNNVGARLMALLGWSGGALGTKGQGITEPVTAARVIDRRGLGLRNPCEERPTPEFHTRVEKILDSLLLILTSEPDALIPDLIFSSELSSEQRKHIHILIRNYYPQLKSVSYGKDEDRSLAVKPKLNNISLFRKVCLQGGLTDKYQIHKPGTLTLEDISKTQDT